jgi:hypothetical protein
LEESVCDICGKTLKQRKKEGWELEPDDKMKDVSVRWGTAVCPVCVDIIYGLIFEYVDKDFIMDYVRKAIEKTQLTLKE